MFKKINFPILAVLIIVALFFIRSVHTASDAYWHMAVGRQIWQTHQIPTVDSFIYSSPNTHFTSTEWLYGLILFTFYQLLGFSGIIALRIILIIAICTLLYKTFSLICKNLLINIGLILTVSYSLSYRFYDRPENFSYLFISLITYLIFFFHKNHRHSKLVYLTPLVFLLWPNIHAFTLIGLYLMSIYLSLDRGINLKKFTKFPAIFLLCIFISILEYKKITYAFGAGTVNTVNNGEFMSLLERIGLSEGYQTLNQISLHIYLYILGLIFFPVAVFLNQKNKFNLKNLLLPVFFLPLLLLPIKHFRLIPLGTLLLSTQLLLLFKQTKFIKYTCLLLIIVVLPTIIYSILVGRIAGSREYISLLNYYPQNGPKQIVGVQNIFWKESFPESTVVFMKNYLNSKRIFATQGWNNYYIWHLPNIKVFRDVLGEVQNDKTYKDADTISYGKDGWEKLIQDYNIDTIINSQDFIFDISRTPIHKLQNWKLVYVSDSATVWAREDIIKGNPPNLSLIHPELTTSLAKFKKEEIKEAEKQLLNLLEIDPNNVFAKQQIIMMKIENNQPEEAINELNNARLKFPKDPIFDVQLSTIYAQQNDCQQAKAFAEEARQRGFNDPVIKNQIQIILSNCL